MKSNISLNSSEVLKQQVIGIIENQKSGEEYFLQNFISPDTDLNSLVQILLSEEVKSKLLPETIIVLPELRGRMAPKKSEAELLNFIYSLAREGFFTDYKISSITPSSITERELDTLEILTSQQIRNKFYIKTIPTIESNLIKLFYKNLAHEDFNDSFATVEQIIDSTKTELEERHQVSLNPLHCLRILSKFEWSLLSESYNGLQQHLIASFKTKQIESESYHFEQEPNLHYNMVKVTEKNSDSWRNFTFEQRKIDNATGGKYYGGLIAFIPSLNFFDWSRTDVWVAFISNKKMSHFNEIDRNSIEMFVTMLTSENSTFTSHSGISRCPTYEGITHKNISSSLHSFIGSTTRKHYQDLKKSMITCPLLEMTEILIKSFEKQNLSSSIYVGFEEINALAPWKRSYNESAKKLKVLIDDQNAKVNDGKIVPLVNLEFGTRKLDFNHPDFNNSDQTDYSNKCSNLSIYDKERNVIQSIEAKDIKGEYVWFFEHRYLYEGQNSTEVLLTVSMEDLSSLFEIGSNQIEHNYIVEQIGDSPIY